MTDKQPVSLSTPPEQEGGARGKKWIIKTVVVLSVLAFSIWYVVRNIDWEGVYLALVSMKIGWIVAGILATFFAHLARAWRWRVLIPSGNSIPLMNTFSATIIGYFMNNLIPRSGELVRPYILSRREKRPMSGLVATIFVERVLDTVSLMVLLLVLVLSQGERFEEVFKDYSPQTFLPSILVVLLVMIGLIVLVLRTSLGERLSGWIDNRLPKKFRGKLQEAFLNFRAGITIGGKRGAIWVFLSTLLVWGGYGLALYFGYLAFGFETTYGLGPDDALPVLAITSIGIALAPTPGGFSVYHLFIKVALTTLYGVSEEGAVAFGLITHAAPYLAVMVAGMLFLLRENLSFREISHRSIH